jgi:hypothetical protein
MTCVFTFVGSISSPSSEPRRGICVEIYPWETWRVKAPQARRRELIRCGTKREYTRSLSRSWYVSFIASSLPCQSGFLSILSYQWSCSPLAGPVQTRERQCVSPLILFNKSKGNIITIESSILIGISDMESENEGSRPHCSYRFSSSNPRIHDLSLMLFISTSSFSHSSRPYLWRSSRELYQL